MIDLITQSGLVGITCALLILGIVGSIIPIIPGQILSFFTLLGYGFLNKWEQPNLLVMIPLLALTAFGASADYWLPALTSQKMGGRNKYAVIYEVIGAIIGLFTIPIVGAIIGYAVGVYAGSYQVYRDQQQAWKATKGSLIGQGLAMTLQLFIGVVVLAIFVLIVYGSTLR